MVGRTHRHITINNNSRAPLSWAPPSLYPHEYSSPYPSPRDDFIVNSFLIHSLPQIRLETKHSRKLYLLITKEHHAIRKILLTSDKADHRDRQENIINVLSKIIISLMRIAFWLRGTRDGVQTIRDSLLPPPTLTAEQLQEFITSSRRGERA